MASANWWDDLPGRTPMNLASDPLYMSNGSRVGNVGNYGLPGGSGSDLSAASQVPWGKVLGTAAPVVGALFAGNRGSITPQIQGIEKNAQDQLDQGKSIANKGQEALTPVLKYFQALMSGNPADVLAATAPQRGRIIDQYDAARKSTSQFTPRGGGQASTQQEIRAKEAGQLSDVTSQARSDAATSLGSLGESLTREGISAEESANQQMAQVLGPLFQQQGADSESTLKTIAGFAALAAAFI